jgi:hypothetical protein
MKIKLSKMKLSVLVFFLLFITLVLYISTNSNHVQFRKLPSPSDPAVLSIDDEDYYARGPDESYRNYFIEEHHGRMDEVDYSYALSFVEFDDQGSFWDERQLDSLLKYIEDVNKDGVFMMVYVHGWMNNADPFNMNVACYREVLKAVAANRSRRNDFRPVIGIYLGWAGQLYKSELANRALTFWNRLNIAGRIGRRTDMSRALMSFKEIYDRDLKSRLLAFAHSMGTRVLRDALGPLMSSRVYFRAGETPSSQGYGDMVTLINPAIPALDIRNGYEYADRVFDQQTVPDFLIVSSENDQVMKKLYPLALRMTTWKENMQPGEDRSILHQALGTYDPFVTHTMFSTDESTFLEELAEGTDDCPCPYMKGEDLEITRELAVAVKVDGKIDRWELPKYKVRVKSMGKTLGPVAVLRTQGNIIPSHGEIWTSPFLEFMSTLVTLKLDASPRERM